MRARRPRRFAFRPALDVLPLRLSPSGGLTFEEGPSSSATGSGVAETISVVQPLSDAATLQQTDSSPLG
jgi:hypothetical protein